MEIYKLKDEVPDGRRSKRRGGTRGVSRRGESDFRGGVNKCGESDDSSGLSKCGESDICDRMIRDDGKIVITDMKSGVKNPERVNVYVNGGFAFSLDVAQVVDYKLKVGAVLEADRFEELRKASEFGKLYQRTLEWVLLRPRSVRETRDYLMRKLRMSSSDILRGARPSLRSSEDTATLPHKRIVRSSEDISELSDKIITRLIARGYVDDRKFAEFWAQNRFVKKGVSRKRLTMELMKKGISREIIDEVLDGRNDEEEIRKMAAKKRSRYKEPEKLMAYLVRQGFPYDLVRKVVEEED